MGHVLAHRLRSAGVACLGHVGARWGGVGVGRGPLMAHCDLCDSARVSPGGRGRVEWLEWEGDGLAGLHFRTQLRHVFPRTALAGRVQMGLRARKAQGR